MTAPPRLLVHRSSRLLSGLLSGLLSRRSSGPSARRSLGLFHGVVQRVAKPLGLGLGLVLLASLTPVAAQTQSPPVGRLLASNCFQCHGTDGKGPGFDRLAGKSAQSIYNDMLEFRSGQEGNGVMAKHSLGYTDAQLRALAQYLSTQR